ncbi:MAG TPA: CBS domain-containing protein, partial [Pyrinomonadaceae bacterium]|nr:CBS domain-containing protein [Pyrinomonadaceae bacterium]
DERYGPRGGGYGRGFERRPGGDYPPGGLGRDAGGGRPYEGRHEYEREVRYEPPFRGREADDDYERRPRARDYEDERDYERGRGRGRGASRSHVRCRDIMTRDVTVALRDTTLDQVARMMRDEDTGVIPVVERSTEALTDLDKSRPEMNKVESNVVGSTGKLVGLITDRDIAVRAVAEGKDPRAVRAEEIMTTGVHTAHPNDRVIDAIRKMGDKQVRRIPVVDRDGNLRGIISMADVALETEQDRELGEALEEISSGSSFWNRIFG